MSQRAGLFIGFYGSMLRMVKTDGQRYAPILKGRISGRGNKESLAKKQPRTKVLEVPAIAASTHARSVRAAQWSA